MGKYASFVYLSIMQGLKNYKSLVGLSVLLVTCLIIFSHLWELAAAKAGAISFSSDHLLWYITLNEWIIIALPDIQMGIEQDLRNGHITYLLPRPISYLGSKFAEGVGTLLLNLFVLGLVSFSFTYLWSGSLPFSIPTLLLTIILGLFSGFVALIFQLLIGLSAFWLQEVAPFSWIWDRLLFVFGGLILPLSVYPLWMQKIASWTPFPAILGARSLLAIEVSTPYIIELFLSLISWSIIGIMALIFCYRRGLRILNIEGG